VEKGIKVLAIASRHGVAKSRWDDSFETIGKQTFKPVQILVIDSSSDDKTLKMCKVSGDTHLDRC